MAVLKKIREFGKRNRIEFTHHARLRMYERGISAEDIRECLLKGRIVESHPNDKHYPSYLLFLEDKISVCCLCRGREEDIYNHSILSLRR